MKRSVLHYYVYGNRMVVACVLFTIVTMFDLILVVLLDGNIDSAYHQTAMRFISCILMSASLLVFRHFEKLSLIAVLIIHFFAVVLLMIFLTWCQGVFFALHPDAYRDAVRSVLYVYPVVIVGGILVDGIRTSRANRILKKLHESRDTQK